MGVTVVNLTPVLVQPSIKRVGDVVVDADVDEFGAFEFALLFFYGD